VLSLSFEEAWREYRRSEPLLPAPPPPVRPRRIRDIGEIASGFDLIALDAWGVLTLGEQAIAEAPAAVARLRSMGKRLAVLSNGGSRDAPTLAARLRGFGFDIGAEEIINGLGFIGATLARLALTSPVGLVADPPAPLPSLTRAMLPLADDRAAYDRASGFVFLSSDGWMPARQALLEASLARHPRPLLVANPDIVSPEPDGYHAEPGYYAHRLAAATGQRPIFCGKPFAAIYDALRARHPAIAAARVLCVGDTLHTDILGGRAAGHRTLLIENGFCRGKDGAALAAECGIWPDFIAPRL
jgi:glycerol 3-phosphatase-2